LAEANEKCALAQANQEINEYWKKKLEKNVEELHESKEKCFEKSLDCVKKFKTSFSKVGAYSSEENFIRGDPEGVIEWISGEAEAFEEILNDRGASMPSPVLEELQLYWRRLAVIMSKLYLRPKLPFLLMIRRTLQPKQL
jgi:hypothetical protein